MSAFLIITKKKLFNYSVNHEHFIPLFYLKDVKENVTHGHLDKIAPEIVRVIEITPDHVNQPAEYVIVSPDSTE